MEGQSSSLVWITYAWVDNEEGDFDYLVQDLRGVGVEARYDKIELVPGRHLWAQIGERITKGPYDGWAYLITPNSLLNKACLEELELALNRALKAKGGDFPLIGLLHGVIIEDVPTALQIRLCVDLANRDWPEEVKAGLEGRPPRTPVEKQSQYVWKIHPVYNGNPSLTAVEVRPRFGSIMYWRFAVPTSVSVAAWGYGPSGGGRVCTTGLLSSLEEEGGLELYDTPVRSFGAANQLSPSTSAYVVFKGELPDFVFFGKASEPFGSAMSGEVCQLDRIEA